jgi:protein-tyrosine phosphatase
MVHWPDYGVLTYKQIDWLVNKIIVDLECGLVVETGCTGGHGRTGTLLACLAGKLLGLSATEAIQHIRKVYCMFAVEKESQIELIAEYLQSPIPSPADVHTHEFRYYR